MIFDVEADGLLHEATKLHVLSYIDKGGNTVSLFDYQDMRDFLLNADTLIGHRIILYDVPLLEKLLGIKIKARLIDTLALSWYLNHKRKMHGLDSFGKDFGVAKPKIDDWHGLTPEQYAFRCEEDCKINALLWQQLNNKLLMLYGSQKGADRLINYLSFKMDCLREQETSQWKLDEEYCQKAIEKISPLLDEKITELKKHMPVVVVTANKEKPAKPYKKDGSLSVTGVKWFHLLKTKNLPEDYDGVVEVEVEEKEPNPNSHDQVKSWLFDLGWEPENFKYVREDDGGERAIPQVRIDGDEGKELCPSVKALIEENPGVGVLDGVTVLSHRLSTLVGFMENSKDGWLIAEAGGFTNTLRLKHRTIVNLPGVDKAWGEEIRGSLVAPDGYLLCGSDMSSLEDNTKKHYMYPHDPKFVEEMSDPDFDPHLDLAKFAGVVTQEEINEYVAKAVSAVTKLKPIRKNYKVANYSCTYGVGGAKLARTTGLSLSEAKGLIDIYWKRNWAVKKVAELTKTKVVGKETWLFNPVSRLWYSLRSQKDIFSTLNQGTGVFCFDTWIKEFRSVRSQLTGQFHDEVILCIKVGAEEKCRKLLLDAIDRTNDKLKLNVTLSVDIQFGERYSDIH